MAMTNDHVNLYNDLGTAAGLLDQRAAEYSAKSVAALAASQALETARAGWVHPAGIKIPAWGWPPPNRGRQAQGSEGNFRAFRLSGMSS
jgi:hypothetical protein